MKEHMFFFITWAVWPEHKGLREGCISILKRQAVKVQLSPEFEPSPSIAGIVTFKIRACETWKDGARKQTLSRARSSLICSHDQRAATEPGTYLVHLRFSTQLIAISATIIRKLAAAAFQRPQPFPLLGGIK